MYLTSRFEQREKPTKSSLKSLADQSSHITDFFQKALIPQTRRKYVVDSFRIDHKEASNTHSTVAPGSPEICLK